MSQNFNIILFNAKLGSFKLNILLLHTVEYSNFALERKRGLCIKNGFVVSKRSIS